MSGVYSASRGHMREVFRLRLIMMLSAVTPIRVAMFPLSARGPTCFNLGDLLSVNRQEASFLYLKSVTCTDGTLFVFSFWLLIEQQCIFQ